MEYIVYHDESKEEGFWHGMYLLPVDKKDSLLQYLNLIRDKVNFHEEVSLKNISNKSGKKASCVRGWLQVAVQSLVQQKFKSESIYCGTQYIDRVKENILFDFNRQIGAKFILFHDKDNHSKMSLVDDYAAKFEITYGMGLKGGLHLLFDKDNPISISRLHFDGYEHLQRNISKDNIKRRLSGLREYCHINDNLIIDDRSSKHNHPRSQSYEDSQFIQLTDLLVGGFRTFLGQPSKSFHKDIFFPVDGLIKRYVQGRARMENSRWYRGFCMSRCFLEEGSWVFKTLEPPVPENRQMSLF